MRKVRIGNDILFIWSIFDAEEHEYPLDGKDITVTLTNQFGKAVKIDELTIDNNVLRFFFLGKNQTTNGKYILTLVENAGADGMRTVDMVDAVTLVPHTYMVGGEDACSHIKTEVIELETKAVIGIPGEKGEDGKSAYEVAVEEGFVGTVEEWLASLKGEDGEPGQQGEPGPQGAQGPQGEKGETGATGATGPQGPQGEKGDTGEQGPQGEKGEKGDTGEQGYTGPQGPQGIQGEKGEKGDTGEQGPQGIQGAPGPQGPQGPAGRDGSDAEVTKVNIENALGYTPVQPSDIAGFITRSVSDLANYYLKSETYTKSEVEALIGAIQQFHYEVYTTLPATGKSNVLYLIGPSGTGSDKYEEYVYAGNTWTKIGDTSIDLSGYVTTQALNTALADYTTTSNLNILLAGKQNTISDLATIRSGAAAGASAVQPSAIANMESTDNKTTSLTSASTDQQYPSAKTVYDFVTAAIGSAIDETYPQNE